MSMLGSCGNGLRQMRLWPATRLKHRIGDDIIASKSKSIWSLCRAAVHWPDVFEQNLKRRRKCVDRLISDIETNWSSTLCLRPRSAVSRTPLSGDSYSIRIPPLLEADIEMVGKCFQRLARKRGDETHPNSASIFLSQCPIVGPALILDVRQSTKRDRHLFLSSLIAGSLLVVGDDVDDQCR